MRLLKSLLVLAFLTTAAAGCQSASTPNSPSRVGAYGTNNTNDPGDITGAGTGGNVGGPPGFHHSESSTSH